MSNNLPKHINHVPDNRKAIAPYNFVELPDKVVRAEDLPDGDRYHPERYTGKIECTLTTSSPLYIRCGYTPNDYADFGEKSFNELDEAQKLVRAEFFKNPANSKPVIPGSSLRGMLRTLVEIISFSKIDKVSGQEHFFFRAVATTPRSDSLAAEYRNYVNPDLVKAGFLKKDGDRWRIHSAKSVNGVTFSWVKQRDISREVSLIKFDESGYIPQYIPVSFTGNPHQARGRDRRFFLNEVNSVDAYPTTRGTLVSSGNMKQGDNDSSRRNHCVIFQESSNSQVFTIASVAIQHYCRALTEFQKAQPFSATMGILENDRPVFYSKPVSGNIVGFFGQSPNFRIPYSPQGNGHAATARDFIPPDLKDPEEKECREPIVDIAEAIFGFVRSNKRENSDQSRAGRVFVSDANCISDGEVWYEQQAITPQILASPKPNTFQHYLVQPEETEAEKSKLKHYASEGNVIRGHKLYWHKGSSPDIKHPDPKEAQEKQATQITKIKPIKSGVSFEFTIHFENLSNIELGALLWILDIAKDDDYRLSLGMGKPLGMGAVKIGSDLYLSNREQRYHKLFQGDAWAVGETLKANSGFVSEFEEYMAKQLEPADSFREIRRIQMLLSMLKWKDFPPVRDTRYMEIERKDRPLDNEPNEYKARRVLPTPLDVRQSDRNHNPQTPPNIDTIKPKPKSSDTPKYREGDTLEAQITNINGTNVTYELPDRTKRTKNKFKQAGSLQVGQNVRVRVVTLKEDGSIKKVEFAGSLSNIA